MTFDEVRLEGEVADLREQLARLAAQRDALLDILVEKHQ